MRTLSFKHWALCALCVVAVSVYAEDAPKPATPTPPAAGAGGGGGGRGRPTPEQIAAFQQQRMDRLKGELGSSDDEFKALQPKIEAVNKARQATFTGGGFGGRRGGGGGGGGGGGAATPDENRPEALKKLDALRTLLENKDADPKAIAEALKGLREERTKAKDSLKKAQDELKELVTAKQEAVLVINGTLE